MEAGSVDVVASIWPNGVKFTVPVASWPFTKGAPSATWPSGKWTSANQEFGPCFRKEKVRVWRPPWLSYIWIGIWKSGVTAPEAMLLAESVAS